MFALDEMPSGYTPEQAFHVLDAYGMAGRNAYRFLLLTIDLIFPFLYGSFLFLSIRWAASSASISVFWGNRLAAIGYIATCCDWLENVSFLILMRDFPRLPTVLAKLASGLTVTKFLASGISVGILAVLGTYILFRSGKQGPIVGK